MSRKINLPLFGDLFEAGNAGVGRPSVDAARAQLGGRAGDAQGVARGTIIDVAEAGEAPRAGVVVFANDKEAHALVDGTHVRRVSADAIVPFGGDAPALDAIAADARVFGAIHEGAPIRYADANGKLREGQLIEKCRYGGLVLREDGTIVAVGFRKLWPVPEADAT